MLFVFIFDVKSQVCGNEAYNISFEFVRYDPGILLEEISVCRFKILYAYEYMLRGFESGIIVM